MEGLDKKLIQILTYLATKREFSATNISEYLQEKIPESTFARWVKILLKEKFIKKTGGGRSTKYIPGDNFINAPLDLELYFAIHSKQKVLAEKEEVFKNISKVFKIAEKKQFEKLAENFPKRLKSLDPGILKKEFERVTIELSWISSYIEGNTYTLLETERLILEQEETEGHSKKEAVMILNHKKTLEFIRNNLNKFVNLNREIIEEVHENLTKDLDITKGLRKDPVAITGTEYRPHKYEYQIKENLEMLCDLVNKEESVLNKIFYCFVLIAYLQPFIDGNKRTSRVLCNAIALANNFPPITFCSIDVRKYKKAMLIFYESHNLWLLKKLFVEQLEIACTEYFQ